MGHQTYPQVIQTWGVLLRFRYKSYTMPEIQLYGLGHLCYLLFLKTPSFRVNIQ